jgi:putative peptidoglycan lipid II flippase
MFDRSQIASNLGVAGGTLVSRITGLARIVVFAAVIGQSALADAFDVGNNAPNVIYELLIGGALTATLVPLFSANRARGDRDATAAVLGTGLVALVVITMIAVVAAPLIFRVYALSPAGDAALFTEVGVALTRVFLLQIFFYGLNALVAGVLNAHERFIAAAWAPVPANLVAIAALLVLDARTAGATPSLSDARSGSEAFWLISVGPTLGIATMALIVLAAGVRVGVVPRPRFDPRHPGVHALLSMSTWAIGYIAANQVALVVVKNLAQPGSGRLDAYAKAMTIFQLPHGLLAVTIATTTAPLLARAAADANSQQFRLLVRRGVRTTAALTIAPSIVLVLFAQPIVRLLLGWGAFTSEAVETTARALSGLSVGLVGFSLYLFVLRGFYSHGDTRTPFIINVGENALHIVLAVLLVPRFDVLGLGLSFALAYLVSAVVAARVLQRRYQTENLLSSLLVWR